MARDMARTHALALIAVLALLLGACGSSTSPPPAYVAAGEAICGQQQARLNHLAGPTTPEQAVSYLPQVLAIMHRETSRLQGLDPPAAKRAELAAGLASAGQLAARLHSFLHELQTGIVEVGSFPRLQAQSTALRAQIDGHLRQAGLEGCV
jgi:hypothetical protein